MRGFKQRIFHKHSIRSWAFLIWLTIGIVIIGCKKTATEQTTDSDKQANTKKQGDDSSSGLASQINAKKNQMETSNNLKQLALSMYNFADTMNFSLPSPGMHSNQSKQKSSLPLRTPQLSWRVQVLPFIGAQTLYQQFHHDEPWDSEHNKKLIDQMPKTYASPGEDPKLGKTHYRVFIGPKAAFDPMRQLTLNYITDGTSNTIMIVEAKEPVIWTKPEELLYDHSHDPKEFLLKRGNYFVVAMFDGSTKNIPVTVSAKTLHDAITPADGNFLGNDFDER